MGTKTLYMEEITEVLSNSVDGIDDCDQMKDLMDDLGFLLTKHFGGSVYRTSGGGEPSVTIEADENVPSDGGVYASVDLDVSVEEFLEGVDE